MSFLSRSAIRQLFMRDVATWGDINVDIVAWLPHYARLGNDSVAGRIGIHSGGSAANAATVLSRSAPSVDTVAQAGQDTFAKYTR